MYKIYARCVVPSEESTAGSEPVYEDVLIYDDTTSDLSTKVISPNLSLEKGTPGSLKMTIPPGNAGYDRISIMGTEIWVMKETLEIWSGRILQEDKDFWNKRQVTCEGELAYLNDTVQPPASYDFAGDYGIRQYFEALLTIHNIYVPDNMKFILGIVTVYGGATLSTDYENTLECMKKVVDDKGGFLRVRKVSGVRYLDYLESEDNTCDQSIMFGKNLIDFTNSFDATEFATVIVPLGAKIDDGDPDTEDKYLTVASVNGGSIYVSASQDVIDTYGRIEKVVHWDQVNDPAYLLNRAQTYLQDGQFSAVKIEISALDLHYLNPEIDDINVGDRVYVISPPHGLNRPFPVNRLDIPLDQPQNTLFHLGDESKITLTAATNKANEELLKSIEAEINGDAILDAAKANAAAIMNQHLNGYVTILTEEGTEEDPGRHTEAIYISDTRHLKDDEGNFTAQRFWKWGLEGLGYTDDYGQTWKTALTMDGSILGERIAAGSIHGSKITAGTIGLTTSAGETGMTIGLEARGLAPGSFEIGDIDQNEGKNIGSTAAARMSQKIYLTSGTTVKITSSVYQFEPFQYSDNNDSESGFVRLHGAYSDTFTVPTSNYYRLVVSKRSGETVNQNELNTIASSFELSGSQAVIRAEDLKIIGMVTLTDVSEAGSTIINGANIMTGTVTANKINIKGLTVRNNDDEVTFSIDNDGNVYVNGNVALNKDSTIYFGPGVTKTIEDISDEAGDATDNITKLANGQYANGAFISNNIIYGPTIIGNTLVAQADTSTTSKSGSFVLRDGAGNNRLQILYNSDVDDNPHIEFLTNQVSGKNKSEFYFNSNITATDGFEDLSTAESKIYGILGMWGKLQFNQSSKIILNYRNLYFDSYSQLTSLIPNPEQGQIAFVLN